MDKPITLLTELTLPTNEDLVEIVDVDSIGEKNKRIKLSTLKNYFSTANLASEIVYDVPVDASNIEVDTSTMTSLGLPNPSNLQVVLNAIYLSL